MTQHDTSSATANRSIPPKSWTQQVRGVLIFALLALVGGVTGYLFARFGPVTDLYFPDWPLVIVGGLLIWLLVVAIHEIGHLLGGWLVGFRFIMIAVGPLLVVRTRAGIRAKFNTNLALFGGMAGSTPTDDRDLQRRDAVMVAGGPIASLLLAALCLGLWYGLGYNTATATSVEAGSQSVVAGMVGTILFFICMLSFVIAFVTLVPQRSAGQISDGKHLQLLLSGRPEGERNSALRLLYGAMFVSQRPREWNEGVVQRSTKLSDQSAEHAMACFLGYGWALDRGNVALAGQFLDQTVALNDTLPAAARPGIFVEAAYFTARYRGDASAARSFFDQGQSKFVPLHDRLRAEAATLLAEGRADEAQARATEGLTALKAAKESYMTELDEDWLRDIITQAQR
jgi:hypothetical protein